MAMQEIHSFKKFSISEGASGDIYKEFDDGSEELLISSSGSREHEKLVAWMKSPDRVQEDFE
jgi:hypothetical protein